MSIRSEPIALALRDEQATLDLGSAIGRSLDPKPVLVTLEGPLGAGKTTLVRGVLRGLGYEERVVSPTYTLMEAYPVGGREIVHLDLYRITDPEELEFLGLRERLDQSVVLLEWPERGARWLPTADLAVGLQTDGTGRRATLVAHSGRGRALLSKLARDPALPRHTMLTS